MPRFSVFLILILVFVWGYTSWYWYTCNIKNACQAPRSSQQQASILDSSVVSGEAQNPVSTPEGEDVGGENTAPILSRDDVLIENPVSNTQEINTEDTQQPEQGEENISPTSTGAAQEIKDQSGLALSGSTIESSGELADIMGINSIAENKIDFCSDPLVGPISLGGNNTATEVSKLEAFLSAQGYSVQDDGIYDEIDFEAVKQLQLDYKQQMLDPWGIETPTGYVGRTTVSTINSISCN